MDAEIKRQLSSVAYVQRILEERMKWLKDGRKTCDPSGTDLKVFHLFKTLKRNYSFQKKIKYLVQLVILNDRSKFYQLGQII